MDTRVRGYDAMTLCEVLDERWIPAFAELALIEMGV
jgi:hypothetical protein